MSREPSKDKCGAKKRASSGYCERPAGGGTDHKGFGACSLHGGREGEVPVKAYQATPYLAERTRELSMGDAEALLEMGSQALYLSRAELIQRLLQPGLTTKEVSDLTISIARLDKLVKANPPTAEGEDAEKDAAEQDARQALDSELDRLKAVDGH